MYSTTKLIKEIDAMFMALTSLIQVYSLILIASEVQNSGIV